ncbi:MAG: hypothetical protein ACT4QD_21570, partial [Acidobacteriota bacterium]
MIRMCVLAIAVLLPLSQGAEARQARRMSAQAPGIPALGWFFDAASLDDQAAEAALALLASQWRDAYASMLVDLARLTVARQEQHASDISHLAPRGGPDDV